MLGLISTLGDTLEKQNLKDFIVIDPFWILMKDMAEHGHRKIWLPCQWKCKNLKAEFEEVKGGCAIALLEETETLESGPSSVNSDKTDLTSCLSADYCGRLH